MLAAADLVDAVMAADAKADLRSFDADAFGATAAEGMAIILISMISAR